ncbi:hypothetical protein J6590_106168, partial [Homalodisca vitripennis]
VVHGLAKVFWKLRNGNFWELVRTDPRSFQMSSIPRFSVLELIVVQRSQIEGDRFKIL